MDIHEYSILHGYSSDIENGPKWHQPTASTLADVFNQGPDWIQSGSMCFLTRFPYTMVYLLGSRLSPWCLPSVYFLFMLSLARSSCSSIQASWNFWLTSGPLRGTSLKSGGSLNINHRSWVPLPFRVYSMQFLKESIIQSLDFFKSIFCIFSCLHSVNIKL